MDIFTPDLPQKLDRFAIALQKATAVNALLEMPTNLSRGSRIGFHVNVVHQQCRHLPAAMFRPPIPSFENIPPIHISALSSPGGVWSWVPRLNRRWFCWSQPYSAPPSRPAEQPCGKPQVDEQPAKWFSSAPRKGVSNPEVESNPGYGCPSHRTSHQCFPGFFPFSRPEALLRTKASLTAIRYI